MHNDPIAAVRDLLNSSGADAILIALQKNVSWLTGGRSHVNTASEPACCNLLVTRTECALVANNIEADRLREEELGGDFLPAVTSVQVWNWYEPEARNALIRSLLPDGGMLKTDAELEPEFLALRSVVPDSRIEEVRRLGAETAEAIEQTAMDIVPGDSEYRIAGRLAYRCLERELEPIVNLIAVDERAFSRRHPLPTGKTLEAYAMLVVCARKNGLIASATRLVHFGRPGHSLMRKMNAVAEIDARIIEATKPGATLGELFGALRQFYEEAGYPDEYRMHHQGGLTGYATREKLATPPESFAVAHGQLYAWNPSIAGVKSEDTIMAGAPHAQVVTAAGSFPTIDVAVNGIVYKRPAILQREFNVRRTTL